MTKVWLVASEAVPFAKTGGLGDVTGALARWLEGSSTDATLVLPLYRGIRRNWRLGTPVQRFEVPVGSARVPAHVFRFDHEGREILFISYDRFFDRDGLYGVPGGDEYTDNASRFTFFAKAVLEAAERASPRPDVLHCHDWQTGLVPFLLRTLYRARLPGVASVFTIHNLGYQGIFGPESYVLIGVGPEYFHMDALEYWGNVCFLKAGILFSDELNTVSPTYAREILTPEFGFGLDGVLRVRAPDLTGILNGIDTTLWDPSTDNRIAEPYSADDLAGRDVCRMSLREELGLDPRSSRPLFGVVSRLAQQKGIDVIADAAEDLMRLGIDLAFLGDGDSSLESSLRILADQYPHRINFTVDFNDTLARKIYAGSDAFLMPSRYEPCGIGQLIALRYGSVPVVAKTGGLADTIRETGDRPNGFVFAGTSEVNLLAAVSRAVYLRTHRREWRERVVTGMREDHSWASAVGAYGVLYEQARSKGAGR